MVFSCDASTHPAVSRDGRERGALTYCLDAPDLSDLAMPALARRGPLQLAISTDGQAPALARRVREELERLLGESGAELDALIDELARLRAAGQRANLYDVARRLAIAGKIRIDPLV
jgi:siroheme synthase-like protein